MHNTTNQMSRRHFLATTGAIAGTALLNPLSDIKAETTGISAPTDKKLRIALVGTGGRGTSMWGRDILKSYPDYLEFVGLCDKNEGRVETGKRIMALLVRHIPILKNDERDKTGCIDCHDNGQHTPPIHYPGNGIGSRHYHGKADDDR